MVYESDLSDPQRVNFMCEELDFTNSFRGMKSAQLAYCYMLVKFLDLFDTIFFVLRKRTRQISFLHVYHHVAILIGSYVAVSWAPGIFRFFFNFFLKALFFKKNSWATRKCAPNCKMQTLFFTGGHPWLFGLLNCFVHVVMYSYYFGSIYSPKLKTNFFIKRSITQLQIVSSFGILLIRLNFFSTFFQISFDFYEEKKKNFYQRKKLDKSDLMGNRNIHTKKWTHLVTKDMK